MKWRVKGLTAKTPSPPRQLFSTLIATPFTISHHVIAVSCKANAFTFFPAFFLAAALLLLVIGLAAANIEMPVVCFNAIDPTPIISATSENMLLPPGPGYTQQWFLSQATLFASQVLWSSRQVACQPYPIEFDVIPAFNVGVPVGNVESTRQKRRL
jgi:hypothetical protein